MTIGQLISELRKYPDDMPVATYGEIDWKSKDDPYGINVAKKTYMDRSNPRSNPDFEYVDLE